MGSFCAALENERERKNEENMYLKKKTEINSEFDLENIVIENQNYKNEELEYFHQKKINLFDFDDEKGKAQITINNVEAKEKLGTDERNKLMKNEENNFVKIREYEINNKNEDNILIKNKKQIILKEYKNLSRVINLPLNQVEVKDQLKFNKDLCKTLASSLPKRTKIEYEPFKDLLKLKTVNLSDKEKSFVIFLWICDNISYDIDSYLARKDVDCTPKSVFQNGSSVSSGYSRLYKDFADYLNLEVKCVSCYAKGVDYSLGQRFPGTEHEYNVIKINNKWYPIDSTWGSGYVEGKKFIKSYSEFYFFANPELLIKTHFPAHDKWQLTKKNYTLEEFLKWPHIKSIFYTFGFENYFPEEGI